MTFLLLVDKFADDCFIIVTAKTMEELIIAGHEVFWDLILIILLPWIQVYQK